MLIAENLKSLRARRGLTQAQLAEAAGTSALYISQIETGSRSGGMRTMRKLAAALDVDPDDIV
jgi:transcriptional regulator with XRE-family HTH domain